MVVQYVEGDEEIIRRIQRVQVEQLVVQRRNESPAQTMAR